MNLTRVFNRQTAYIAVAVALLLATFVSALVSAAQVTERSIELSSSSKAATGVSYTINFTPAEAGADSFVVDFCTNTPLIGEVCDAPVGLAVAAAVASTAGFTVNGPESTANMLVIDRATPMTAGTPVSVTLTGITNPNDAGTVYARILTYDTALLAAAYASETPGTSIDEGGVAMSITSSVGVSGDVLESLTFCVAGVALTADCANAGVGGNEPVLKLGEDLGNGVIALSSGSISTGNIYTQITTNAVDGATVYLKSSAIGCGGLVNSSKPAACDIQPAKLATFAAGTAAFGVKTSSATPTGTDPTGTLQPVATSPYNNTGYAFNWITGDATGVTGTFGDPFMDTDGAPANNQNVILTFGASVNGNTPAGSYSTDLSLIATGKF